MFPQILEGITLKVIQEAIKAAKDPNVQEDAAEFAKKITGNLAPAVLNELKNLKPQTVPLILSFIAGATLSGFGISVLLLLKAGIL